MTHDQRLHHEQDPRVRRSFAGALAVSAVIVLVALAVVGLRVQHVRLAYRLDVLRAERLRLDTMARQLEVEVATLRAPGRLEARARQLGMIPPRRDQVRPAREFVAGSAGLAALERNRIATIEGVPATP
jgi:cell division protein FtsL